MCSGHRRAHKIERSKVKMCRSAALTLAGVSSVRARRLDRNRPL